MNNRTIAAIYLIVASLMFPAPLLAATATGSNYEVELVVFQNLMPELEGKEIWSPERVNLQLGDIDKASKAADTQDDRSSLGRAVAALGGSNRYRMLAHKRWVQTAEARSTSQVMRITSEGGELDGTFVFYLSRFLHVDVQMLLKDDASGSLNVAALEKKAGATGNPAATDAGAAVPLAYRIDESRRIRSGEIHYFDHPKLGVLVQITPKD